MAPTQSKKKTEQSAASAIISTGGKQYLVTTGSVIAVEKLTAEAGQSVTFDQVLLVHDGATTKVGTPTVSGASVTGEVVEQFRGEKIRVFTYKSKKRQRRTLGHRQSLTKVKITGVALA